MRIAKLGLQFADRQGFQDYREFKFADGWTLIIGRWGSGKTTIIRSFEEALGGSVHSNFFSDLRDALIEVDFQNSEGSKTKIKKIWSVDGEISLSIDDQESEKNAIQPPENTPIIYCPSTNINERLGEISDIIIDAPNSINEMNEMLRMFDFPESVIFKAMDGALFLSFQGGDMPPISMDARLVIEYIFCLGLSKISNAPIIIDGGFNAMGTLMMKSLSQVLVAFKESNPDIQIIATTPMNEFGLERGENFVELLFDNHIFI